MLSHHRRLLASGIALLGVSFGCLTQGFAATPVNLRHESISILKSFVVPMQSGIKQEAARVDFNKTKHIRIQQTYAGYPVWGADGVVHIEKNTAATLSSVMSGAAAGTSMNGMLYQKLNLDLQNTPAIVFSKAQSENATKTAIAQFEKKAGKKVDITDIKNNLMVYVDADNKAHWAYYVEFYVKPGKVKVAKPIYIMDAVSFNVYKTWDNIQTDGVAAGGFGGNVKTGQYTYDGLTGNLSTFNISRDATSNMCTMINTDVVVKDVRENFDVYQFSCETPAADHNNAYWNGTNDAVNDGYSPADDAMFAGTVIKNMYQDWYGRVPLVDKQGNPMQLALCVHNRDPWMIDNAYWDGKQMVFGDGETVFYPLVSIGVAGHEISHGFTEQNSHLAYFAQSGGMNEAFSDMAAQAAEYYAYGHNSWQIGPEIFKAKDEALRYMDQPSKDCKGSTPGDWCSIDDASQYSDGLDVHFSSGVYNRFFYLLGTAKGWNTKMAFNLMVQANENYWTSTSTFAEGACGVLKAAQDYNKIDRRYDLDTVKSAISGVGISPAWCV